MTRTGVQLLVGQTATINLQMAPSTVQETVTVTAEAPLLNVATSSLGGNIDPQQVSELPVQGRNWMALALLAPGSRTTSTNANAPLPDRNGGEVREYQTNLDGMQVTNSLGGGGQPTFSQEMIAEFQFISNRFDATQGRSPGVQVNVITKSGTNRLAGSFRGNFRDDRLQRGRPGAAASWCRIRTSSTPDRSADRSSGTGCTSSASTNTSASRAPASGTRRTRAFNISLKRQRAPRSTTGARLDYQLSPQTRLMVKGNLTKTFEPFGPGSNNNHPASTQSTAETQNTTAGAAHAGAEQPRAERGEASVGRLHLHQREPHPLVEALDGARAARTDRSPPARRASSSPASTSPATTGIRGTAARTSTACATTSRCRTTRAAVTT